MIASMITKAKSTIAVTTERQPRSKRKNLLVSAIALG